MVNPMTMHCPSLSKVTTSKVCNAIKTSLCTLFDSVNYIFNNLRVPSLYEKVLWLVSALGTGSGHFPVCCSVVVFAHTTEAFEEDIEELDCHIVPYYEDSDSDSEEHIYEEAGFDSEGENFLILDRKSIVTRSRSYSGKVPGYVPETVPEETGTEYQNNDYYTVALEKSEESEQSKVNTIIPTTKSRRFLLSSQSAEGPELTLSTTPELGFTKDEVKMKRKDDSMSLPCVITSSGSFSQKSYHSSSGVSTPTSLVDIPPPFELAYITKRPVTKSSPALLIHHEPTNDKNKKKKTSFKRFLTLKFKRKSDSKGFSDGSVRSSRSSSESSHHGPSRVIELDRRSTGSSPQLHSRIVSSQQRSSDLPSTIVLYKDQQRKKGELKSYGRGVSRVESFEERSRRSMMPLPLTKPRSISFPSADTSDYENIPAMSADYENIQIPGRPIRSHTVTEFFENPNRTTTQCNDNDGYVDMNSFPGIENKTTSKVDSEREESPRMVDVILSHGEDFRVFDTYISEYDRSMFLLEESRRNSPAFANIVKTFEVTHSFTIVNTFLFVNAQHFQLLSVYERCALSHQENLLRLVHIEFSVKGKRDLLKPGRMFVKEGTLMKVSRKSRQPRHLFLMNDIMLYTYPQQDGKYRLKNTLSLSGMKVSKPALDNVQNCLRIEVSDITITLSASSIGEREDWFHTLSRAIRDIHNGICFKSLKAREKLWMALGEAAPVLVPVSHVMMCMNCTSDFSLTLRRHHCNACGKVVCRACSRNRYPLKYLKDRMAKVCDHCYMELRKRGRRGHCNCFNKRIYVVYLIYYIYFMKSAFQMSLGAEGSTMSGSLQRRKKSKRKWKRLWFLLKDKVLYTFTAREDKVASESLPLQGFTVKLTERADGEESSNVFHLYHKKTLYYTFRADDQHTARRWVNAIEEATVL
uniref:Uncharacterized protein n=1 Tax=Periophthalmus magnuspinnatus TaxID=409849 RepID=A0A3B3Z8T2_9GOBI